jgi:hypothetical protein
VKIPNADAAEIPIEKLRDYALSSTHPFGKEKARVFRSALGWSGEQAEELQTLLLNSIRQFETATLGKSDVYGQRYILDIPYIGTKQNEIIIRSTWIILTNGVVPRLTSCYIIDR